MTVSNQVAKSGPYIGNGVTTTFDRTFKITDASHLAVQQTLAGVTTSITSGFTQTGVGSDTGTVVFSVAPVTGASITLFRDIPFEQQSDYTNEGKVPPEVIEADLDRVVMMIQSLEAQTAVEYGGVLTSAEQFADASSDSADASAASASAAAASAVTAADAVPVWRGAWLTSTAYTVNDLIVQGSVVYICLEAHTSGTFATDLSATKWEIYTDLTDITDYAGDLNDVAADGLYRLTVEAPANGPVRYSDDAAIPNLRGATLEHRTSADENGTVKTQILTRADYTSGWPDQMWVRAYANSAWGAWRRILVSDTDGFFDITAAKSGFNIEASDGSSSINFTAFASLGLMVIANATYNLFSVSANNSGVAIGHMGSGGNSAVNLGANKVTLVPGSNATTNGIDFFSGAGSPEGVVTAPIGSLYSNKSGGSGTTLYIKESGTGNTGWAAK